MDKLVHYLFLLSFVVCIYAKVEWKIEEKISAYGEDLRLLCIADNYAFDGVEIKRWEGGPKRKMLTLNGAPDEEDVMKYNMSMRQDGFDLVIKNVTEVDLNVTYGCTYGFKSSGKVILKIEDAFEVRQIVKPSKRESEGTNIVIICVIIVSSLVIAAVCILILLHKYGKLKEMKSICHSNNHSVHRHDGDIPLREPQVNDQFIPQLSEVVIHPSNGDLPSGRPQETDQLMPQLNGFANHLSNEELDELRMSVDIESTMTFGDTDDTLLSPIGMPTVPLLGGGELVAEEKKRSRRNVVGLGVGGFIASQRHLAPNKSKQLEGVIPEGEEGYKEDASVFVSVPPNRSELETSVAGSKTLEPCKTESDGESVDETSLKDNHDVPASVPERGFQYSTSQDHETKMHLPDHIKFRREYLSSCLRTESFNSPSCKWSLSNPSIKQMAKAGFFCSGYETRAQCFSCGAKRCWQEGDDPLDEHFHDSECRHLKHIKEKQATGEDS